MPTATTSLAFRQPEMAAPVATYKGWALRADQPGALNTADGCDASGQEIPFAATKAERLASGGANTSLISPDLTQAA